VGKKGESDDCVVYPRLGWGKGESDCVVYPKLGYGDGVATDKECVWSICMCP